MVDGSAAESAGRVGFNVRGYFNVNQSKFGPPLAHHFNAVTPWATDLAPGAVGAISQTGGPSSARRQVEVDRRGGVLAEHLLGFAVEAEASAACLPSTTAARLTVGLNESNELFLTVNRWAYESDINQAARIPGVVPGVGGIAALAFGAAGIRRRRERIA